MLLLYILLFFQTPSSSSDLRGIRLDQSESEYLLPINELPILVDSTGLLSFQDILALQENSFNIYKEFKPKDYCVQCAYWIRVPLRIEERPQKQWMLEFYDQTIDSITAFIPRIEGGFQVEHAGDYFDFSKKSFAHKNFEWLINSDIEGNQNLYFRVKSHTYADIRVAIRTVNRFVYYSLNEYFLYGIFYGMIVVVSIYNILMFVAIRERKYLYYAFYIASVFVYAMCIDGIAYQYLWPSRPQWNQIAYGTALFSLIFWALLFSKRFLNTKTRAPKLDKLLFAAIVIRSAIFVYSLLFDHQLFQYRNLEIISLTLIFYSSIHVWLKGYKPARFFVLAYGMLFLGFLLKALLYLAVIPLVTMSYYSLHVAFLLEMLFLTFALSDRVRILKANRDRAMKRSILQHQENAELKDKVNRELEEKIQERTVQLEEKNSLLAESNHKLYMQTEEINKMNSKLDLDNWKLKNNVKEALQDRFINKNLTLEQFSTIFPNQISCYRFLENLKWGSGFKCHKCNHTKSSEGKAKFSRRCSRCGYDESITSNTVFHRIKFPIEKAFFILYIVNNSNERYTLDQLSETLELRRNTVWSFKRKIGDLYKNEGAKSMINDLFTAHWN